MITINNTASNRIMNWKELYNAKFAFDQPFYVRLEDKTLFYAEKVIRLVPKRRLIAFGTWQGKVVVAKLFFKPKQAKQHLEKEVAGIKLLIANKIPTPPLYYQGTNDEGIVHVLLFERIVDCETLEVKWKNKASVESLLPLLKNMIVELATQHVLGVLQRDLHLKNFLITEKIIYTLDAAEIDYLQPLLSKKLSMLSLAGFCSQLGVEIAPFQDLLYKEYARVRGWLIRDDDFVQLKSLSKKISEERWAKFSKKILRNSSDFQRFQGWGWQGVYQRQYEGPEWLAFLKDPDAIFNHPETKILKAGRSATVIQVKLDQRDLVIKRYNMKNAFHRLRRCLRRTRAQESWRLAQKLTLFGIRTAKPVAFIEKKLLGLNGRSYFVMEYVSNIHAGNFFAQQDANQKQWMVTRIAELLKNLVKIDLTHGDLKITNILIDKKEQPVLIDLDGAREHTSIASLTQTFNKEIKRFLMNFREQPLLCEKFKIALEQ